MSRFKEGQEVVCIVPGGWVYFRESIILGFIHYVRREPMPGPKKDEIVTVSGFSPRGDLFLMEYPTEVCPGVRGAYPSECFEPVVPSETIEELMNSLQESL